MAKEIAIIVESPAIMPEIVDGLKAVEKARASRVKQTHGPMMAVKEAKVVIKEHMENLAKDLAKRLEDRLEDAFNAEDLTLNQSAHN